MEIEIVLGNNQDVQDVTFITTNLAVFFLFFSSTTTPFPSTSLCHKMLNQIIKA